MRSFQAGRGTKFNRGALIAALKNKKTALKHIAITNEGVSTCIVATRTEL